MGGEGGDRGEKEMGGDKVYGGKGGGVIASSLV